MDFVQNARDFKRGGDRKKYTGLRIAMDNIDWPTITRKLHKAVERQKV